jgi:hypothetical protein
MDIDLWGLDLSYLSFKKIFISSVLHNLHRSSNDVDGAICLYLSSGHPVKYVELVGIVVRIAIGNKRTNVLLDDGTGSITCYIYHNGGRSRDLKVTIALVIALINNNNNSISM